MYQYKVKYIIIVEDEDGNYIGETAGEESYDTEEEAQQMADVFNAPD